MEESKEKDTRENKVEYVPYKEIREAIIESYVDKLSGILEPYEIMSLIEQRIYELLEEDEAFEDGQEYPDFD